ncbi:hypothetical protein QR680_013279 [Steinernema hermaphroditum]|uniref:MULE transposase domain-containing protein n=1 Tax=Steinernema hermaphroditum TaxID=289476 RepID=A0AA39I6C1_9BILA|nr:hypothetical protein QR680_013279 [Steinernema hermaphroditum]
MNRVVIWGISERQRRIALFESVIHSGVTFEFRKDVVNKDGSANLRCTSCEKANRNRKANGDHFERCARAKTSTFEDGAVWITDPDSNHGCIGDMNIEIETEKVAARQTYLVTSQALESDPRTASVAHQQALRVVSANARSEEEAHNVRLNFPSKRTARRTYQNHARKAYPKADSGKIPECFKTVLSPAAGHLEQTENQWLLHSEEDYSVHIFCDAHALRNLWRSDCIVLDGNYKYAPPSYQQVYSFVSVFNDLPERSEGIHSGFALMQRSTIHDYVKVFENIRDAMLLRFGRRTTPFRFRIDCEKAALSALKEVFPRAEVKLCRFHFSQAIRKKVQTKGLSATLKNNRNLASFVKGICGSVCLPRDLQGEYILHKIHQLQQDPELWEDVKVREFAGYITSYWMPLEIFGSQHPPVNVFLHHFRLFALENSTEGHQLQEGHRLIARRRKIDIEKSIKAGHAAMILEAHLMDSPSVSSTFVDRFCRYHAYLALPKRRLEQIHDGVLELHGFTEENERQVHSETEEDDSDEDESTEEGDSDEDEGFNEGPLEDDNFEGIAVDSALAPVQVTQSSSNIAPYLEEAALSWNISVGSFPELFIAPSDLFSDDVAHDYSLFHY